MTDKIFNFLINYFSNINDKGVDEMNNFRGDITPDEIVEWLKNIQNTSSEQPSEDLEEVFDEVLPNPNWYISNDGEDAYNVKQMKEMFCAGSQWQKEKIIKKASQWLNENVVEYHPRKGELRPIVNINAFREAMEKEDE